MLCRQGGEHSESVELSEISEVIADPANLVWVDVRKPTTEDFDLLKEEFDFHPLALEDAAKRSQRPKLDSYENHHLLVFYSVEFDVENMRINEHELAVFIGDNYLVTVHHGSVPEIETLSQRWMHTFNLPRTSVGVLLYHLLDMIVDDYPPVLDAVAECTDAVETRIFDSFDPTAQRDVFTLRKELLNFRRVLGPERDVMLRLTHTDLPMLDDGTAIYFQDVYDHVVRATDSVDLYRDLLNSALDAYLSLSSNSLNATVRRLTSVSIILMSLSLIAGIYGMNFENMPELTTRYGYFVVLGFMVVLAASLGLYFRRRRWL